MKLSEKKMTEQRPPPLVFGIRTKKFQIGEGRIKEYCPMNKIYKYTDISDSNMIFSLKIKFIL